ncbi:hypothetical protein BG011_001636, partial [Mortierella polycephala]
MPALIAPPAAEELEIPMVRISHTLKQQVELLEIYHYHEDRKENLLIKLFRSSFGRMIGVHLLRSSFERMIKREASLRAAAEMYPTGAHYIVNRKNALIEEDEFGEATSNAPLSFSVAWSDEVANETVCKAPPSFSHLWFNAFKRRYRIAYCQIRGEAGSVDLEAVETELDETGFYLMELDDWPYATPGPKSGVKGNRSCRITALFCVNASGSSLAMANIMSSLRPLVI